MAYAPAPPPTFRVFGIDMNARTGPCTGYRCACPGYADWPGTRPAIAAEWKICACGHSQGTHELKETT